MPYSELETGQKGAPGVFPAHLDQDIAESRPHSSCLCATIVVFRSCETFLLRQCDGQYAFWLVFFGIFSYITRMFGFDGDLYMVSLKSWSKA